jgi:hypothetical protein
MEPYLWWDALVKCPFVVSVFGVPSLCAMLERGEVGSARAPSLT